MSKRSATELMADLVTIRKLVTRLDTDLFDTEFSDPVWDKDETSRDMKEQIRAGSYREMRKAHSEWVSEVSQMISNEFYREGMKARAGDG